MPPDNKPPATAPKPQPAAVIALLTLFAAAAALAWQKWPAGPPAQAAAKQPPSSTVILSTPRTLAPLSLRDQHDRSFRREQLRGRWSLLFFGYTHCPDICAPTLARLAETKQLLHRPDLNVIFVSVDPGRDHAPRLRKFLKAFQPQMIGLHGAEDETKALALQMGAHFRRETKEAGDNYLVRHSPQVFLVDPAVRLTALFQGDRPADQLADELHQLLPAAGP